MLLEALVTFSNLHNQSEVSQREEIQPNTNTMETYRGLVLTFGRKHGVDATIFN